MEIRNYIVFQDKFITIIVTV